MTNTHNNSAQTPFNYDDKDKVINIHSDQVVKKLTFEDEADINVPNEENLENNVEKFELNKDDSSDEEDIKDVQKYNLHNSLEEFSKIDNVDYNKSLSFISHAVGLELLYSKQVQQKYYNELKPKLKQPFSEELKQELQKTIAEAVKSIIENCFLDESRMNYNLYSSQINFLVEDFYKTHSNEIKSFENYLFLHLRPLLKSYSNNYEKNSDKDVKNNLDKNFSKLCLTIEKYIDVIAAKQDVAHCLNGNHSALLKSPKSLIEDTKSLPLTKEELNNYPYLKDSLKRIVFQKTRNILTEHGAISPSGNTSHTEKVKARFRQLRLELEQRNSNDQRFVVNICDSIIQNSSSNFGNHFNNNQDLLLLPYFEFLIKSELAKGPNASIIENNKIKIGANFQNSLFKELEGDLEEFIPLTSYRIMNSIQENITNIDKENLLEIYFEKVVRVINNNGRQTLPNLYNAEPKNMVDFIANLRLLNRSAKRNIKNNLYQGNLFAWDQNSEEQKFSVGIKFPLSGNYYALETQKITSKANRSDLVINASSYAEISSKINTLKSNINKNLNPEITDKEIAFWIRETLKGEKLNTLYSYQNQTTPLPIGKHQIEQIKRFLSDITYLLFGTEVVRNPAALVHHQMALDLILKDQMTWQEFFTDSNERKALMPMEIRSEKKDEIGAVKCARTLHLTYNKYMPHSYNYPKEGVSIDHPKYIELVNREGSLVEKWFDSKSRLNILNQTVADKINSAIERIYVASKIWYKDIEINVEGKELTITK
ncbi:MAG: hypothetical protein ACK4OM_04685 [Alphaproteobacteria bacterium]